MTSHRGQSPAPSTANLLADLPATPQPDERIDLLAQTPQARIERIVSTGQASPPGFWYDQPWDEWVVLLTGAATLRIAGEPEPRRLGPGDHLMIPAHRRHRVESTSPDAPTVWLAVHLRPVDQPSTSTESPS
ncbi:MULTISPECIES: cupin domain-containing protein [Methylobacterium]|uniref:cupin domain-containing protein n=1 Tax=Methylobacterium TaxID=407 RepID=UPI0013EC62B2|nr:cupin domain-containing protein [Methylobacterium sp. DB0501]NGM34733.1 cupin domain-containing protein [Methylobacterium sp. DB0501]